MLGSLSSGDLIQSKETAHRITPKLILLHVILKINGLVQDCSISSALAMEILQFCTKPSKSCKHGWL